ncbi:hypothetical protein N7E81_04310 [Reichenbachiella carrageenanivorans]|uniref:Uncharacterized protein n=1 Tax=Reichenbachiella carrageenanivorans TaxID=2979869 RepID=A0ABY6D2E0_9BACT|nr:hypothetical protein [Reichenbachiella carrageenanivorans]UXX80321.1 hypothetical protein N7E81_04310 [Reichenbachiella carrageenanivorans]
MKLVYLLPFVLWACQPKQQPAPPTIVEASDTVILKIDLNQELAGSAYRKKATGYLMIANGDSAYFSPTFTESIEKGRVNLIMRLNPQQTYAEQITQLQVILPTAAQDYNFDSLSGVYLGRLVHTGDLAIAITNEYVTAFGGYGSTETSEYRKIERFLTLSKLGSDLNAIFNPYGLQVTGANVEKVFFTKMPAQAIDSVLHNTWPERILDASVWVELKQVE